MESVTAAPRGCACRLCMLSSELSQSNATSGKYPGKEKAAVESKNVEGESAARTCILKQLKTDAPASPLVTWLASRLREDATQSWLEGLVNLGVPRGGRAESRIVAMEGVSVSPEGEAVMEDGLGPEDVGNSSPESDNCGPPEKGPEGGALVRTKSLGHLGGCRITPVPTSLKFAELSERQREEITFPARTFDYLRDDIRQTIIDLINFKINKETAQAVKAPKHDLVPAPKLERFQAPKTALAGGNLTVESREATRPNPIEKELPKGEYLSSAAEGASEVRGEFPGESLKQSDVQEMKAIENNSSVVKSEKREGGGEGASPESFLLVHNVAKRHNLGTLARSATAFGVSELILVGRKDFNAFGSHGATLHLQFRHFHTLAEAVQYLKAKEVAICGVEITEGAAGVHAHPFTRSTAFVLGNEGTGLSEKEMEICDFFVYIPQCGPGTASLNVTVAASIVLHHFAVWAGFPERERDGQKYVVAERPVRRGPRNMCPDDPEELAERRRLKAESAGGDWLLCDALDDAEDDDGLEVRAVKEVKFSDNKNSKPSGLGSLSTMFD